MTATGTGVVTMATARMSLANSRNKANDILLTVTSVTTVSEVHMGRGALASVALGYTQGQLPDDRG